MPIVVASDILRRLQDSLYALRPTLDDTTAGPATRQPRNHSSVNLPTTTTATAAAAPPDDAVLSPRASTPSHSNLAFTRHSSSSSAMLPDFDSDERSQAPHTSAPFSLAPPVPQSHDPNARHRQVNGLCPATQADPNAQSILRQRIIEIQALHLPERDKARRVQVCPRSLRLL